MPVKRGDSIVVAVDGCPQPTDARVHGQKSRVHSSAAAMRAINDDHRRLNGGVERIIQKGATSQQQGLELVCATLWNYAGESI